MHEKLLKAVTEAFPTDKTRPGIVTSWLGREAQFYASICRYHACGTKTVVVSAREDSLEDTLKALSKSFLEFLGRGSAIDALMEAVK